MMEESDWGSIIQTALWIVFKSGDFYFVILSYCNSVATQTQRIVPFLLYALVTVN